MGEGVVEVEVGVELDNRPLQLLQYRMSMYFQLQFAGGLMSFLWVKEEIQSELFLVMYYYLQHLLLRQPSMLMKLN